MNGSFANVPADDELVRHRLDHRLLALAAREVVVGGIEPVLADARVDRARWPSIVLLALARSASPATAGSALSVA